LSVGELALFCGSTDGSERLITFPAKNFDSIMRDTFAQSILVRRPPKNPADKLFRI
jgi:hypothetical protein